MTEIQQALPIPGEQMTCFLCHRTTNNGANWKVLQVSGYRYQICPDHFPTENNQTRAAVDAYLRVVDLIAKDVEKRNSIPSRTRERAERRQARTWRSTSPEVTR